MNSPDEQPIESLLRHPPRPATPADLKEKLLAQSRTLPKPPAPRPAVVLTRPGWLQRWWPVLAPAGFSVLCAVVLAVQQREIRDLKQAIATMSASTTAGGTAETRGHQPKSGTNPDLTADDSSADVQELSRLKELAGKLSAEVVQLEKLRAENRNLRARLAAPSDIPLTTDEMGAMEKARDRALKIACINNMKQFGLAVRVFCQDTTNVSPPDVLSMSNELNTPKILVCPAETNRQIATSWATFTPANCSYEYLTPNAVDADQEPQRVMARCPIHGNVTMCDGSVQSDVAKVHPEWFYERDGKLYYNPPPNQFNYNPPRR